MNPRTMYLQTRILLNKMNKFKTEQLLQSGNLTDLVLSLSLYEALFFSQQNSNRYDLIQNANKICEYCENNEVDKQNLVKIAIVIEQYKIHPRLFDLVMKIGSIDQKIETALVYCRNILANFDDLPIEKIDFNTKAESIIKQYKVDRLLQIYGDIPEHFQNVEMFQAQYQCELYGLITELLLKLEYEIECQEKMLDIVFSMCEADESNAQFLIPLMMVPQTVNLFLTKTANHPEYGHVCFEFIFRLDKTQTNRTLNVLTQILETCKVTPELPISNLLEYGLHHKYLRELIAGQGDLNEHLEFLVPLSANHPCAVIEQIYQFLLDQLKRIKPSTRRLVSQILMHLSADSTVLELMKDFWNSEELYTRVIKIFQDQQNWNRDLIENLLTMIVYFQHDQELADKYRDSEEFIMALDEMLNNEDLTDLIQVFQIEWSTV